jgi:DNA methylase/ParB-like nuclease domain
MIIEREPRLEWITLESITTGIQPRGIQEHGVRRLLKSMHDNGFLPQFPLVVSTMTDGYRLLAGHHRVEAARRIPCPLVPALIYTDLTSDEEWHLAVSTNRAHEAATLPTFIDDVELVWRLQTTGKTLEVIADIQGWKSFQIAGYYAQLKRIVPEGWALISTTFQAKDPLPDNELVEESSTTVEEKRSPFNERILREIVHLTPSQQLELIKLLIKDRNAKGEYKGRAERYRARNKLKEEAEHTLRGVPPTLLAKALEEIDKGYLDKEWLQEHVPGAGFQRLMQQVLDEHAQKQNYRLYYGNCVDIALTMEPESVDVILTDPPYGEQAPEAFAHLAAVTAHLLKPGGSLVVMCGQYHFIDLVPTLAKALKPYGIKYYWMLSYLMPGAHATRVWSREVNTFWKPVLWFVKKPYEGGRWLGDVAKSPVHGDDKRHHPWGQSEGGMADLLERIGQVGDTVCDPFMGAGTTGVAAIRQGRKFIGIEVDADSFAKAELRLAEAATQSTPRTSKAST